MAVSSKSEKQPPTNEIGGMRRRSCARTKQWGDDRRCEQSGGSDQVSNDVSLALAVTTEPVCALDIYTLQTIMQDAG